MANPPLVRLKLERSGHICLDGTPVSLRSLRKALSDLKKRKVRLRYYREGSRSEASKKALAVWEAVMETGLPVELCDDDAQFRGDVYVLLKEEKPDDDIWWA